MLYRSELARPVTFELMQNIQRAKVVVESHKSASMGLMVSTKFGLGCGLLGFQRRDQGDQLKSFCSRISIQC